MNNTERHIVSRIKWDLNFDQKDQASLLQSDLSSWTKVDMLKEMNLIFEKLCPPGQTWSIEELELDLGHINLSDLKNDLPVKFRNALLAKLQELAYKSVNGEGGMKVSDIAVSQLQLLEKYLEMGYMPWNRTGANSVNELFAEQFVQNRQALIRMMKRVGKSRDVRRRIAWQFNESSIHKLVKELEPNNHAQIIEFTEEFTKIREKEAFVQSSVPEFKKNLWFWVLNHLFTERGTLFNRLDFMDSSIHQMARHYNLSYEELFNEIEQAVEKIGGSAGIKPEFIQALELLSKRNKKARQNNVEKTDNQNIYFSYLKFFLSGTRTALSEAKVSRGDIEQLPEHIDIDELILNLYEKDKRTFYEIIAKVDLSRSEWKTILSRLQSKSTAIIIASLSRSHEALVRQSLTILNYFKPKGKRSFGNNFWELSVISHLSQIVSTSFSKTNFVDHLINELKEERQKETFFMRLNNTKSAVLLEHGVQVSTYQLFQERLKRVLSDQRISTEKRLEQAIRRLFGKKKTQSDSTPKMTKNEAVAVLKYWIGANPTVLFRKLSIQEKSTGFLSEFFKLYKLHDLKRILKSISDERATVLLTFYEAIKDAERTTTTGSKVDPERFFEKAFSYLLMNQTATTHAFLNAIVEQTKNLVSRLEVKVRIRFVNVVLSHSRVQSLNLPQEFVKQLEKAENEIPDAYLDAVNLENKTAVDVSRWLDTQLSAKKSWILTLTLAEGKAILNKLVKDAYQLERFVAAILRKYENEETATRLKAVLRFTLWNCVSKFTIHKGNVSKIMDMVEKTLVREYKTESKVEEKKGLRKASKKESSILSKDIQTFRKLLNTFSSQEENKKEFDQIFESLLIKQPELLAKELSQTQISEELTTYLIERVDVELFVAHVFGRSSQLNVEIRTTFELLFKLVQQIGTLKLKEEMNQRFWLLAIALLKKPGSAQSLLEKELGKVVSDLTLNEELTAHELFQILQKAPKAYPDFIKKSLIQMNTAFKQVLEPAKEKAGNTENKKPIITKEADVQQVFRAVLNKKDVPYWMESERKYSIKEVLEDLVETLPFEFYKALQSSKAADDSLMNLLTHIEFKQWVNVAKVTYPNKSVQLDLFNELFYAIGNMTFKGVRQEEIQKILFIRFIKAWKNNHWRIIDARNVWNEVLWDLSTKLGIEEAVFFNGLKQMKELIPAAYRFSLAALIEAKEEKKSKRRIEHFPEIQEIKMKQVESGKPQLLEEGIAITNAGLVIVNSYVRTLFERLALIESGQFKSAQDQERAVHYLQFIVNGLTSNEEHHLVLNKVMCGMHPTAPVNSGITLNEGEKELIEGMIEAIISYWLAIGNCSVNGFRGNWLIRDGMLSEDEDRWNLTVEKRAYDILINQSPFSFSIIKYPWMEKPIHVNWAY